MARWKPKFQFSGLPVSEELKDDTEVILLWRSVIDQAVYDVIRPVAGVNVRATLDWLRGRASPEEDHIGATPGFYEVCGMACLHPERVQEKAEEILAEHDIKLWG